MKFKAGGNSDIGISGYANDGTWMFQLYGTGAAQGFLTSNWGNWDLRKVVNDQMYLRISGTDETVYHTGNETDLFSKLHVQTNQLQLRSHTNSWNGGIKFISNDGNNESQLHMDNSTNYDLMVDSSFYVGGFFRVNGDVYPHTDNTRDLGTSNLRWRNIYTGDLNLSNKGGNNDVDGSWGNYTIQEGESDLFLINNRSGKKYKFMLEEVN